jgi:homoserine kinase
MKIKVRVPASTSNLGSGFDVFGGALRIYNEFSVETVSQNGGFVLRGEGKDLLPNDETNIVWQIMDKTFKRFGCEKYSLKNLKIVIDSHIPLGSGLGSSAAAIVGAIAMAGVLCGKEISKEYIAKTATNIEGHPDNVFPAVFGGLCLCYKSIENQMSFVKFAVSNLKLAIINPSFEISTQKARKSLPKKYKIQDIIFNLSRTALLGAAFAGKNYDLLKEAVCDKIHQPYRSKNIPKIQEIFSVALKCGAKGVFISGSGPSIAAFVLPKDAQRVCNAMGKVWIDGKIGMKKFILDFDNKGIDIKLM